MHVVPAGQALTVSAVHTHAPNPPQTGFRKVVTVVGSVGSHMVGAVGHTSIGVSHVWKGTSPGDGTQPVPFVSV